MAHHQLDFVLQQIHKLMEAQSVDDLTDGQLLERFAVRHEQAAFEALVQRHGPLVLSVCRRVLGDFHEAEDAFQATFLVLVRKARSLDGRDSIANWLYTVAYRLALRAKIHANRRRTLERGTTNSRAADPLAEVTGRELCAALDEELQRLRAKHREPLVLCYLEGKTRDEAAQQLGWTLGRVKGRLERGREILRARLTRRGLTLSSALLAAGLSENAAAALVPGLLVTSTVRAATAIATGPAAAGGAIPAGVAAMAEGVLRGMIVAKVKAAAILVLALGFLAAGAGLVAYQELGTKQPIAKQEDTPTQHVGAEALPLPMPEDENRARTDRYGDPLPPGALARMGTVRFRHGGGPGGAVTCLAFSPDGQALAEGGDNTIRLWEVTTGKQLRALKGHEGPVRALVFSGNRKVLASASEDETVRLWDLTTGKEVRKFLAGSIRFVAFSPDGKKLAVEFKIGPLRLWDVDTGQETGGPTDPPRGVTGLAFSLDSKSLAASCRDHIRIWEVVGGKELRKIAGRANEDFGALAFAPDGRTLASGGSRIHGRVVEQTVLLWDMATGKELRKFDGQQSSIEAVAFSPDGTKLAARCFEGSVHLWDVATGKEIHRVQAVRGYAPRLVFSPDGTTLASGSAKSIQLWDVGTGERLHLGPGHEGQITSVAFAPDGKTVVTTSLDDPAVRLWDTSRGRQLHVLRAHELYVRSALFLPDGKSLVSAGGDGMLRLWDAATGKELRKFPINLRHQVVALGLSPDGKMVTAVSLGFDPPDPQNMLPWVHVWEVATGKQLVRLQGQHSGFPCSLSPDSKVLAAHATLRETATGREVLRLRGPHFSSAFAFSPDGKVLATWCFRLRNRQATGEFEEDAVRLWELVTGKELLKIPTGYVTSLTFSPGGTMLATGGESADPIQLWDVATGLDLLRRDGHEAATRALAFSPDGKLLASGLGDGTTLVWDLTRVIQQVRLPAINVGPRELEQFWADLAGDNGPKAHTAIWTLVSVPDKAVAVFKDRLQPATEEYHKRIRQLIADLDSNRFAVRQKATQELERQGAEALPAMLEALQRKPSAEARRRLEALLVVPQVVRDPETVRRLRAIQVLEQVGSKEARQILQALAEGAAVARETQEAKATLERLAKRPAAVP